MTQVREIHFGGETSYIGLHAYSELIFCGLHPQFASSDDKHFLVTLDIKYVDNQLATGLTSEERMLALSANLGVKSDGYFHNAIKQRDLILKECLRCIKVEIEEAPEDERPVQKRLG